jgi:C4-dicarboxylate-specific signal transduction histidine kinase
MGKNGQPRWLARLTFTDWAAAMPSTVVIVLACLWRNHSGVIQFELFVVAILTGGWFAGPIPGSLIALLPILLFACGVSPLNGPAASRMDLVVEWLLLFILGAASGWLGARQRRLQRIMEQTRSEFPAETKAGTERLEKANAALQADIAKHKQTEFALRRSEAYLAEAERLSHTGSWAYEVASGVPVYWSLERCRISKFDPVKGHPTLEEYRALHTQEDWEKLMEAFQRAIRDKTDFETDSREVLADGSTKYLHIVGHPVRNSVGDVVELVGSTMDVTERRQTEEALHKAQTHLNHMTHLTMMGELAASIAHEVNQPLAAVVTNANACLRWLDRESPDLTEAREAVQQIILDGNRGSDVIARIRALLKKEPPASARLDINEVIREILALAQTRLQGIITRTELAENLPSVPADRVHLQQVLLNLMTNAVDAMKPVSDRPRILRIQTHLHTPQAILVSIRDSGTGLDPKNIEQLFEPFYTTKPQGLGMGLSISRSIIEAHGGHLWAETQKTPGATFRFTLPTEE